MDKSKKRTLKNLVLIITACALFGAGYEFNRGGKDITNLLTPATSITEQFQSAIVRKTPSKRPRNDYNPEKSRATFEEGTNESAQILKNYFSKNNCGTISNKDAIEIAKGRRDPDLFKSIISDRLFNSGCFTQIESYRKSEELYKKIEKFITGPTPEERRRIVLNYLAGRFRREGFGTLTNYEKLEEVVDRNGFIRWDPLCREINKYIGQSPRQTAKMQDEIIDYLKKEDLLY
jgi:hypothetical protein